MLRHADGGAVNVRRVESVERLCYSRRMNDVSSVLVLILDEASGEYVLPPVMQSGAYLDDRLSPCRAKGDDLDRLAELFGVERYPSYSDRPDARCSQLVPSK